MNASPNHPPTQPQWTRILVLLGAFALLLVLLLRPAPGAPRITASNAAALREVHSFPVGSEGYPPRQFALNGDSLLTTSGYVNDLWRLDTGSHQSISLFDAGGYTPVVFFSGDQPIAAFQDWITTIRFLDMETGATVSQFTATDNYNEHWALSPDRQRVIYRDFETGLIAADLHTGAQQFRIDAPASYNFRRPNPTFNGDGSLIATSLIDDNDGNGIIFTSFLWDATTGDLVRQLGDFPQGGLVYALAFSHDGSTLAVGGNVRLDDHNTTSIIQLWDVAMGEKRAEWDGGALAAQRFIFSPDDRYLVAQGYGVVWLWDLQAPDFTTPRLFLQNEDTSQIYYALAFNPTGDLLAVGAPDGVIEIYDVPSARRLTAFPAHTHFVSGFVFSDDGTRLISTGYDNTARIWAVGGIAAPVSTQPASVLPTPIMTPTVPYSPTTSP